jgi:hypothetical protein
MAPILLNQGTTLSNYGKTILIQQLPALLLITTRCGKPSGPYTLYAGIKCRSGKLSNKLFQSNKPSVDEEFRAKLCALGVIRRKRLLSMCLRNV